MVTTIPIGSGLIYTSSRLLWQVFPSAFPLFSPRLKVTDLRPPEISLTLSPGMGLFMAVLVRMTIAGRRWVGKDACGTAAAGLCQAAPRCQQFWEDLSPANRDSFCAAL